MDAALLGKIAGFLGAPAAPRAAQPRPFPRPSARPRKKPHAVDAPPRVRLVVFSKDRAFQLRCLLRSTKEHFVGAALDVVVLWRGDGAVAAEAYETVAREFAAVRFERERNGAELERLLLEHVVEQSEAEFILLGVDDALAYRGVDLGRAARVLEAHEDVLAFQLKLSPHVSWSHAASAPCAPPQLAFRGVEPRVRDEHLETLFWQRSEATLDWDYGWDLCFSLYRAADVELVLRALRESDPSAVTHPNRLEASGARALAKRDGPVASLARKRAFCACLATPALSVLAVNRVQVRGDPE